MELLRHPLFFPCRIPSRGFHLDSNLLDEVSEVRYSKPFSNNKRFKISMVMGSEAHERVKCPFVWDYTIDKKKILRAV
jgi:hypothetical protein